MPPPVSPATSSAIVASPPSLPPPTATRRQLLRLASRATAASFLALLATGGDSNGGATAARAAEEVFDPVTEAERAASAAVSERVGEAVRLLEQGRSLQARGAFAEALAPFTAVAREYGELALAAYARVGRALVLYEVGDRDESIAEMEEASVALRGYPEIHAALAAALYADKHAPLLAENQFAIATLLDPHYTDLAYVRDTKHWPPSLVTSLQHFITLS